MEKVPVLDLGRCVDCEACLEICPRVFVRNVSGYIEVAELPDYPEGCIQEAINCCPTDCIAWQKEMG